MMRKEKALQPQEKVCQPQLVAATVGERGKGGEVAAGKERLCGNLKPSIGREEMGGRKVVTENGNGRKKITASEKKRALNGEKISQCQKSQCPQQQPARQPPHPERIPGQPPTPPPATKKGVGSCKPASRAEEYGLPNYVFEEGGKEKTWKDKAINVREKSEQRPITILHKLHHQVCPSLLLTHSPLLPPSLPLSFFSLCLFSLSEWYVSSCPCSSMSTYREHL